MSTETATDLPITGELHVGVNTGKRRTLSEIGERGKWWRLLAIVVITAVVLVPIIAVVILSLTPSIGSTSTGLTIENFGAVFTQTSVGTWLGNSLIVAPPFVATEADIDRIVDLVAATCRNHN